MTAWLQLTNNEMNVAERWVTSIILTCIHSSTVTLEVPLGSNCSKAFWREIRFFIICDSVDQQ